MATFAVLAGFTEQGIRNVKETINRAEAFREMAKKSGVTIKDMYWTLGCHDIVVICEAPHDETVARLRQVRDAARLFVRRNEEGSRQDGLNEPALPQPLAGMQRREIVSLKPEWPTALIKAAAQR